MKWKVATAVLAALTFICATIAFFSLHQSELKRFDAPALVTQVRGLNQLTTVRYTIQRVVGLKELKDPVGEESLLLMVQGEVLAGVDLADLTQSDIKYLSHDTVRIQLPAPKILEAFIDEKNTSVWDRHITWWTPWVPYNPELEHKARLTAIEEIRKAALSGGILGQSRRNAEVAIKGLLTSLGLRVTFSGT